jgi:hypothetical protein
VLPSRGHKESWINLKIQKRTRKVQEEIMLDLHCFSDLIYSVVVSHLKFEN